MNRMHLHIVTTNAVQLEYYRARPHVMVMTMISFHQRQGNISSEHGIVAVTIMMEHTYVEPANTTGGTKVHAWN